MPFILSIILFILQATPALIRLIMEIWGLIKKQPSKEERRAARDRLFGILTKAKEAKFVSSSQATELETLLEELKTANEA